LVEATDLSDAQIPTQDAKSMRKQDNTTATKEHNKYLAAGPKEKKINKLPPKEFEGIISRKKERRLK
jgi:hypothetical protein